VKRSVSLQLGARLSCAPLASLMKMRTLATRWKDLEERRRRAAEMASGDADAGGDICVLSGEFFAEAWLDQPYVKWCCEHMHIHEVSGNRLAGLNYLTTRIAAKVEVLDALCPDTATAEITTSRRLAALEAWVLGMEQTLMRLLASFSDRTPGGEEPSSD